MMQADFTPRLNDWLAARTERVLASVVKYDASVHTVTCKLFHYSSSLMFPFFKDWLVSVHFANHTYKKNTLVQGSQTNVLVQRHTHTNTVCIYIYIYIYIYMCIYIYIYIYIYIEPAVVMQFLSLKSYIILIVWLYYIFIIVWLNFTWVFVSLFIFCKNIYIFVDVNL